MGKQNSKFQRWIEFKRLADGSLSFLKFLDSELEQNPCSNPSNFVIEGIRNQFVLTNGIRIF